MSEIKPALTAEEWGPRGEDWRVCGVEPGGDRMACWSVDGEFIIGCGHETENYADMAHALAALALHGQPFGFTWEDVELLEIAATEWPAEHETHVALQALADRIAALLPHDGEDGGG